MDGSSGRAEPSAGSASAKAALVEHYDERYAGGGFGYADQRAHWLDWSRRYYVEEFGLRRGETLLDVGCGDGFWSGIFAELGLRPTGIDISPVGVEVARSRYPDLPFEVADVDAPLPFAAQAFDVVFCRGLTQFARQDLQSEANRGLVARLVCYVGPGGLLLVSYSTRRRGGGTPEHPHYPASELVRLLETAADPFHLDLRGNALQIAAQRWDAPRHRVPAAGREASAWPGLASGMARRLRRLGRA